MLEDIPTPPEALRELWQSARQKFLACRGHDSSNRFHLLLQTAVGAFCLYCLFHLPGAGTALLVLPGMSALMLFADMKVFHKAIYACLIVLLIAIEYGAMNRDRTQLQSQFEISLQQEMGSDGFPFFEAVWPARGTAKNPIFPVRVFYTSEQNVPLIDVQVDVRLLPVTGERADRYIITGPLVAPRSDADDIFHPKHYYLGTIIPGTFETQIELEAGRHYGFLISTRRGLFDERINFDPDDREALGWKISQCISRLGDMHVLRKEPTDGAC